MSTMQWGLIVGGVLVVAGIYLLARRKSEQQAVWDSRRRKEEGGEDQLDFWNEDSGYDEFGVGKARPRQTGKASTPPTPLPERKAPQLGEQSELGPVSGPAAPVLDDPPAAARATSAGADDVSSGTTGPAAARLVVVSVRERDERLVSGESLHQALQSCGLQFGEHQIYHRFTQIGEPVFSVASMVKPGFLDPADADQLATPGVSIFLQLPGPTPGAQAIDDVLETAQAIAERINGELLDAQRQPLTVERIEEIRGEVQGL